MASSQAELVTITTDDRDAGVRPFEAPLLCGRWCSGALLEPAEKEFLRRKQARAPRQHKWLERRVPARPNIVFEAIANVDQLMR